MHQQPERHTHKGLLLPTLAPTSPKTFYWLYTPRSGYLWLRTRKEVILVLLDVTLRTHLNSGHEANKRWKPPVLPCADHPKAPRIKRLDNECDYTPIGRGQRRVITSGQPMN
jgi:hypothetical protein